MSPAVAWAPAPSAPTLPTGEVHVWRVDVASFRDEVAAPLPDGVRGVAIYSRSDGIVSWEACLDESAEHVEVESSHTGMSVNPRVYDVVARVLDEEADTWTG